MPNQRRKDKRNVTVTFDDELRVGIERYAKINGLDRTAAIKKMCRDILKMPPEKPVPRGGVRGRPGKPARRAGKPKTHGKSPGKPGRK